MQKIFLVGVGGFIGASFRYYFSGLFVKYVSQTYPYGTLFVNILGALLIGFIMEASLDFAFITPSMRLLLTTGMLGGLTTFSTFSYETIGMLSDGNYVIGSVNILANVSFSLLAVVVGRYLAQLM
ncbi:fluoride efflux transporter CrcB [Helicovermis profundi]|uniref:Fluoride-specific ion channel FluC n=1 Tax=Helicovermis profundi TaxID=3065157 RepID=A0AAU9EDE7_9FIRM|nr:fluoride efflux transporter CrcB [Clostridia bacterium S502]